MAKRVDPPASGRGDRSLAKRAKDTAAKALSIKVIVFVIGTGLLVWGKIDTYTWLGLAFLVITGRFIEKKFIGDGRK